MTQEMIWANGEGNHWFARNKTALKSWRPESDLPLQLLEMFRVVPKKVLGIGVSNGYRMASIASKYNADCYGIDPSIGAIQNGNQQYQSIHLFRGVASELPFQDEEFDLVVINQVFQYITRQKLLQAVSEIDRVLQWDGYLLIGDFLPTSPCKVKYRHLPNDGVWTYKQDYSEVFTASKLYHIVGKITGSHSCSGVSVNVTPQDRIGVSLLQKRDEYEMVDLKIADQFIP